MLDPISMVVTALVTGAAAALKPTAEQAIKDAYAGLKELIQRKYERVNIKALEEKPKSKPRQDSVREDLEETDVGQDEEVLRQAQVLLQAIEKQAPEVAGEVGVKLEDIKGGAALRIQDIIASGTGVDVKNAEIQGDIDIKQVRSGQTNNPPK
ncbi:hypothetical protein NIES2111_68130 (plasmid) [Nostoc sp. NIES-2111]|nr:hypothetical protein NIES2111_68130 [Nostoc sp. NIES-2111]